MKPITHSILFAVYGKNYLSPFSMKRINLLKGEIIRKHFASVLALILIVTGCSIFVKQPSQEIKGDKVICFLFNNKRFKAEVVKNVSRSLSIKGYTVVTGDMKKVKYYNPADYGAVVYMAELWIWHTPWHAKRYYSMHNNAQNIIFVITSGDPNVVITKPFDAVTSASKPDKVESVSQEIMKKLDIILTKS